MNITEFIGASVKELLSVAPFNKENVQRTLELRTDRPSIDYEFISIGVAVVCDLDETIRTIFLSSDRIRDIRIIPFSFSMKREEIRNELGRPSKSGAESKSPILGPSGAWDRFKFKTFTFHIEYKPGSEEINKVTLMRNDIVPE